MDSTPSAVGASAPGLSITLPEPISGDAWTYLGSRTNAALAVAAAYESADEGARLAEDLTCLTTSPMFLAAKACYRRDLHLISQQIPTDAAARAEFVFDVLLCRMYLAGTLQASLPAEAQHA